MLVVLHDGTNTYVYGLGLISATDATGAQTYYLRDDLGSTVGLTDGSGNQVATYTYDAFGALRQQTGSAANDWLFTGQQRDSDSGLFYLRARHYDPATGRFLSRDPYPGFAVAPQTLNPYVYVGNNPATFADPSGRVAPLALVAIGVAVVEVGFAIDDAVTTVLTLSDPTISTKEKAAVGDLFIAGLVAPGGGYATGGRSFRV